MTIRRRLVIWVVALFTGVLLAAGAGSVIVLRNRLIGHIDELLARRAGFIGEFTGQGFGEIPRDRPDGLRFPTASDMAVVVVDAQGNVEFSIPSGPVGEPDPLPQTAAIQAPAAGGLSPVLEFDAVGGQGPAYRGIAASSGDGLRTVVVAIPIESQQSTVRAATLILAVAGALAVVVLGAAVWWAIRTGLRPIEDMVVAAGRIAGGDLSHRVSVPEPDSEVGQLALALNFMLTQIETGVAERTRSEQRMRQFLSDASHELRTPLTSIRGYAELHRRGATSPEQIDRSLSRIEHEAIRMSRLVEDLLLLARLDQGRPLATETVDVDQLVNEAVQDAKAVEPARPITYQRVGLPAIVIGDGDRLRQATANLLANVRAHTPPSTSVTVTVSCEEESVTIEVADHGPGLDIEVAGKVFERFYQANPDRITAGSGLGLSIVQAIVEAHFGTVTITTAPAEGFVVTISLPVAT